MDSKKKLFYSVEMDPNFIAMSIISLLYALNRFNKARKFKYPQKLSSLIYFMNSSESVNVFSLKLEEVTS